jgi:predicted metal-dependent enzyme (double-stranded beta helix superfamily)
MGMFDVDTFIADCIAARAEAEPRLAIKEVLAATVARGDSVAHALPPERAELVRLHVSDELTILKVVWAPGMTLRPHDHRMWAAIGIYTGQEDNAFFRREHATLASTGGKSLRAGELTLLGDDMIHSVTNPSVRHTGAIHIYGGDFFAVPRSEWDGEPLAEQPYDVERTLAQFAAANAS